MLHSLSLKCKRYSMVLLEVVLKYLGIVAIKTTTLHCSGGTPLQVWMGGIGWGTPYPRLDGVPPPRLDGVPLCPGLDGIPPPPHQETDQHNEHLLRGGRYASCVHAGGLPSSSNKNGSSLLANYEAGKAGICCCVQVRVTLRQFATQARGRQVFTLIQGSSHPKVSPDEQLSTQYSHIQKQTHWRIQGGTRDMRPLQA